MSKQVNQNEEIKEIKVSTIEELKKQSEPKLMELTGFCGVGSFYARLKQPSMLQLALGGAIPNELLSTVNELYRKGPISDKIDLKKHAETMNMLAKQALVEPTYDELQEAGLTLTDTQLTEIYLFCSGGVRSLKMFRTEA